MENRLFSLATDFSSDRFPDAHHVIVAGSTSTGQRTPSSDIDLLVIGPPSMFDGAATSLAQTTQYGGEIFEVFAYTAEAFDSWASKGIDESRPTIVHMLLDGIAIKHGSELTDLRGSYQERISAGPRISDHELDLRRYRLTDLADDLISLTDALEVAVVKAALFDELASFLLLANNQWLGSGKWLARRLRQWDGRIAHELTDALLSDDSALLLAKTSELLEPHGGRLQAEFVR
jgi:hypothetical protein